MGQDAVRRRPRWCAWYAVHSWHLVKQTQAGTGVKQPVHSIGAQRAAPPTASSFTMERWRREDSSAASSCTASSSAMERKRRQSTHLTATCWPAPSEEGWAGWVQVRAGSPAGSRGSGTDSVMEGVCEACVSMRRHCPAPVVVSVPSYTSPLAPRPMNFPSRKRPTSCSMAAAAAAAAAAAGAGESPRCRGLHERRNASGFRRCAAQGCGNTAPRPRNLRQPPPCCLLTGP